MTIRFITLFFLLISSSAFSITSYPEYEELGKSQARKEMLFYLLNKIEFINSEISHMEAYELKSERYYFYKGANNFHLKCYEIILDEWEYF